MQVLDVALVTGGPRLERLLREHRPVEQAIAIGRGVYLGGLNPVLEREVMVACEPRGQGFEPTRLHHPLYSFYRSVETNAPYASSGWDPGGFLRAAVACSHLVRLTSAGFEGDERQVVPFVSFGKAWLPDMPPFERATFKNWLTPGDAAAIAKLVTTFFTVNLPTRVHDAFFFFESAAYIRSTNIRWPVMTTAAEALLKVYGEKVDGRPAGSTRVFVKRMKRLAESVESRVSEEDLRASYEERSRLVHTGMFAAVPLLNPPDIDGYDPQGLTAERRHLYVLTEEVVRRALMKCILDPNFAQMFANDESVMRYFPLT